MRRTPRTPAPQAKPPLATVDTRLRRDLRASLWDGVSFSVMVGIGETYLAAFVLALGLGQVAAGLVATLPLLAGAVLQMASPAAVRLLGSHKRWVVACAAVQAASFVPLVVLALVDVLPAALVFVVAALYWGAGMATGPAWNTWIGTLVPLPVRPRFFAWRTRFSQVGILVGFVAGGLVLQAGTVSGWTVEVFAVLFAVAAVCRFVSVSMLAAQSEPVPPGNHHRRVPAWQFVRRLGHGADGSTLLYLLAIQTSVQIASPYFTPFMIKQLQLSYLQYMGLIAAAYLAKIVALPALGSVAKQWGTRRLLWWGSVGIIPLSGMWLVSNHFGYLLLIQVAGGFAWAAYELAIFLILFETIPEEERTSVLTTYNLAHALATVAGSLIGGAVLLLWGAAAEVYLAVFVLSSVARLLSVVLLHPRTSEMGVPRAIAMRTMAVRPTDGTDEKPILASIDGDTAA